MNKALLTLSLILISVPLVGCSDDYWKEEFGTPELFLSNVSDHWCYVYKYDDQTERMVDSEFEIKNAISDSGPFEKTTIKGSKEDRFFTYEIYISPSNAGPNYCKMSIYDDGFIRIDHKSALGPHQYAYFLMDEEKATTLIDFAFIKVDTEKENY